MGITRQSMSKYKDKPRRKYCKITGRLWAKKQKTSPPSIDLEAFFEEELYELNSNVLHLKLYVKKMMYEYIGDTRAEIAVFYAMAKKLHDRINDDYHSITHTSTKAITIDIQKYKEEYEGILDLCGTTTAEVYDNMFDENDDGYETPPRTESSSPVHESKPEKEIDDLLTELSI
jgi:hypothetical protein